MRKPILKNQQAKSHGFDIGKKASEDGKLNLMAMHLEAIFERGVNFKTRTITIDGEISEYYFNLVDAAMAEMESQSRRGITIKINSEGGSVYQAMSIVGRIRESKCKITTKGYGCIMSAATLILAAGHERKISHYSWFMHHESRYGVEGTHSEIKRAVNQAEKEERVWSKWMQDFTKKDEKFWYKAGADRNSYYTAEELLDLGVVDEVF